MTCMIYLIIEYLDIWDKSEKMAVPKKNVNVLMFLLSLVFVYENGLVCIACIVKYKIPL